MTALDRFIQSWRIRMARPYIRPGARLLDIGAADAPLYRKVPNLDAYVGVDPDLPGDRQIAANARLTKGFFPQCVRNEDAFDCITMLAVLEHIPTSEQSNLANACRSHLKPGGYLVITVPSPLVDRILALLKWLRLIDGMALEEHYGYDVSKTPGLFCSAGFRLHRKTRFQLGLNNLFVFVRS